jgi:hypothetical protein
VRDPGSGTGTTGQSDTTRRRVYTERLYVTWYWWPLPLLAAAIIAAEVQMGYGGVMVWLPYTVLIPLTALLIFRAGRAVVAVDGDELLVGDNRLPLHRIGAVEVFPADRKRKVLGPYLDPAAYVLHKGWVGPVVRVRLTDPADPTPYWLFSTRHPERLAEILRP